jgi:hypothetical protein
MVQLLMQPLVDLAPGGRLTPCTFISAQWT